MGIGACLLMLAAISALIPQVQAQRTAEGLSDEERETLRLHPIVKGLDDAAKTIDGWIAGDRGQDDAIEVFDEDAARAAEAEYQARQQAQRLARQQAQSPQERMRAYTVCTARGEPTEGCEREYLLPEEVRQRQADRARHVVTPQDRLRSAAAGIGARDTVLMMALERECTDNARPSDYCRELVQKAETLGQDARALLDDPEALAYLRSMDRAHMPRSFFRARQVVLQPGAESHFREGMNDAGERVQAPISTGTAHAGDDDGLWASIPSRGTPASGTRMLADSADPAKRADRQRQVAERNARSEQLRREREARGGTGSALLGALLQTAAVVAVAQSSPDAALALNSLAQSGNADEANRRLTAGAVTALAGGDAHQVGQALGGQAISPSLSAAQSSSSRSSSQRGSCSGANRTLSCLMEECREAIARFQKGAPGHRLECRASTSKDGDQCVSFIDHDNAGNYGVSCTSGFGAAR